MDEQPLRVLGCEWLSGGGESGGGDRCEGEHTQETSRLLSSRMHL